LRSVTYRVNYFAIFVLLTVLISMSLLARALLHDPPLGAQLLITAEDTAQTKVHIGAMHYDAASRTATIENIAVDNPPGFAQGPAMVFGKLTLHIDSEDLGRHPIWGKTKRKFLVSAAQIENVRVFLEVRPDRTNISTLLRGLEPAASVKDHTKPGRPPVTLVLGDVFAPTEFDLVTGDGKATRLASGGLKELAQINHDGGALASEAMAGIMRAFGRAALTEAARRNLLKGLNSKGLEDISGAFNAAEQNQTSLREYSRAMARRLAFFFNIL
jgi:hypothetical protein